MKVEAAVVNTFTYTYINHIYFGNEMRWDVQHGKHIRELLHQGTAFCLNNRITIGVFQSVPKIQHNLLIHLHVKAF